MVDDIVTRLHTTREMGVFALGVLARSNAALDAAHHLSEWISDARLRMLEAADTIERLRSDAQAGARVAWQRGERELAQRWIASISAKLGAKPDHASDLMWLDRINRLLFSTPAPDAEAGEPVAWRYQMVSGGQWFLTDNGPTPRDSHLVEPLYDAALAQEAFTLRNQLDAARADAQKWLDLHDAMEARAERAEAEVARLREALKPFAAWVDAMEANEVRSGSRFSFWSDDYRVTDAFCLRDFRAARAALQPAEDT